MKRNSRGMVTIELAYAVIALAGALVAIVWVGGVLTTQVRCVDTAAEVARQAARGDQLGIERAKRDAPAQARITTNRTQGNVQVTVSAPAKGFGVLPVVPVEAKAEALVEPGQ